MSACTDPCYPCDGAGHCKPKCEPASSSNCVSVGYFSGGSASASPGVVCAGSSITFSAGASAIGGTIHVNWTNYCCEVGSTNVTPPAVVVYSWSLSSGASGPGNSLTTNLPPGAYTWWCTATVTDAVCGAVSTNLMATATVVGATLQEVDFTGSVHPMYQNSDDHGGWGVGSLITTNWTASVNNPACFTRNTPLSMNVTLAITPPVPSGASCPATLVMQGPNGLGGSKNVTLTSTSITVNSFTTDSSPTNIVCKLTPTFNWGFLSGNTTNSIGSSTHTIYVTYADPLPAGGSLTPQRLDTVTASASGSSDIFTIANGIYFAVYYNMDEGTLTFCDRTAAVAKNFAFVGSTCAPGATPLPGGITDNWFMYSPVVSGVWDIRGACIAFAELNNLELQMLGIGNGTPVDLAPVPDSTACSLVVQYDLGNPSYVTNYFVCNGTSYQAFLRYCGDNAPNNFEGALQVVVGTTTNYYAGASDYVSPDPGQILKDVSTFEFWQWTTNYDAGFLMPPSCCANYCTIVQGCPSAATMSAPNCP